MSTSEQNMSLTHRQCAQLGTHHQGLPPKQIEDLCDQQSDAIALDRQIRLRYEAVSTTGWLSKVDEWREKRRAKVIERLRETLQVTDLWNATAERRICYEINESNEGL